MVSVDVVLAFANSLGAARVAWSSAPSCLDSLQVAAHRRGQVACSVLFFFACSPRVPLAHSLHLLPSGLFSVGSEMKPSGLVPTPTEEDVYLQLGTSYIGATSLLLVPLNLLDLMCFPPCT